mgnify:CR=1 FL=1
MLSVSEAEARAAELVAAARQAGAYAADALYIGDASTGIQVRLGQLDLDHVLVARRLEVERPRPDPTSISALLPLRSRVSPHRPDR